MNTQDKTPLELQAEGEFIKIISPVKARGSVSSVVRSAVQQLRDRILASEQGQFLGSEEELIDSLKVSRPTFRQVARLLEHEQLLRIKKGPGGGFFTRQPSLDAVVHLASICLVSRKAKLSHMEQAGSPIYVEAAKLAARNPDLSQRKRTLEFYELSLDPVSAENHAAFVRLLERFSSLVFELSQNPVLSMFIDIVREFAAELHADAGITMDHRQRYLRVLGYLAQAIVAGDAEVAELMAKRLNTETQRWIYAQAGD